MRCLDSACLGSDGTVSSEPAMQPSQDDLCITPEDAAAYICGQLDNASVNTLQSHAARCASCRALLSALVKSDSGELLGDATPPAVDSQAATLARHDRGADCELAVGARVGRYVVLERLGAGGMGMVYAAHDDELERNVAIKVLR